MNGKNALQHWGMSVQRGDDHAFFLFHQVPPYGNTLTGHQVSMDIRTVKQQAVTVENGQIMDLDEWKERLTALGYERTAQVDGMGQFSIRGGIVDIFPLTEEVPVRIEL